MQSGKESGVSLVLRIAPDDTVIYANQSFADYLGYEKQMLIGCPLETIRDLCEGEIRGCFFRSSDVTSRNALVTDKAGRVFEAKTVAEAGVLDIILDEVTSLETLLAEIESQSGLGAHSLSEAELSTFRRPDRRVVTICATRLRDLTALVDHISPLELRIIINSFSEEVGSEMFASGGTMIDSAPESLTAIFGAPRNHANHAMRAILSAINQTEKLESLRKVVRRLGKELPATGCGVWTGEAVVGSFGGQASPVFSAVGEAADYAAQLSKLARAGEILVSESTASALSTSLPEGWEMRSMVSEVAPDLGDFSWSGDSVRPLPTHLERKVIVLAENSGPDAGDVVLSLEYLWCLHHEDADDSTPVLRVTRGDLSGLREFQNQLSEAEVSSSFVQMLGRYRLIKVIGAGGMGKVWKAEDRFRNIVAVKVLHSHDSASQRAVKRFRREAEIMAKLAHRNICRIFETGESDGIQYLAMEFVDGLSLADLLSDRGASDATSPKAHSTDLRTLIRELRSGREASGGTGDDVEATGDPTGSVFCRILPFEQTLSMFAKICDAVQFAHEHGILHRDLKPGNILLREDGEPLVADFGLAKSTHGDGSRSISQSGNILGTLANMAPEQTESSKDVDERADVYALGTILYLMTTGERHFKPKGNVFADIQELQRLEPPPPRSINPRIDPDLEVIILKALRVQPDERYRSVSALLGDLERYRRGEPITAKPLTFLDVSRKLLRTHRTAAILTAGFLIMLSVGTAAAFWQIAERARIAEEARRVAEQSRLDAQASQQKAEEKQLLAERLALEARKQEENARTAYATRDEATRRSEIVQEEIQRRIAENEKARAELEATVARLTESERLLNSNRAEQSEKQSKLQELEATMQKILSVRDAAPSHLNSLGMKFVAVPGTGVQMAISETTVAEFEKFAAATSFPDGSWRNPGFAQLPQHPVVNVSWKDAQEFCEWLSAKDGVTYRLPTTSEWFAALFAGQGTNQLPPGERERGFLWGTARALPPKSANVGESLSDDSFTNTSPVKTFAPSKIGVYDQVGNALEWCSDPAFGDARQAVVGASWDTANPDEMRLSYQMLAATSARDPRFGFRVVYEVPVNPTPTAAANSDSLPVAGGGTAPTNTQDLPVENLSGGSWKSTALDLNQVAYIRAPSGAEALLQVVKISDESNAVKRTHSIVYRWRYRPSSQSQSVEQGVGTSTLSYLKDNAGSRGVYNVPADDHSPAIRLGNLRLNWLFRSDQSAWILVPTTGTTFEILKSQKIDERF